MRLVPAFLTDLDWDGWFGYTTKKTVFIRDRWLGFVYYSLVALILLYIFGVQILMYNEQFQLSSVEGIPRISVTHPTDGLCDESLPDCKSAYRSFRELAYCREYNGDKPLKHQAGCKFEDTTSISHAGDDVDNKFFIPTAVEIVTERRACRPSRENGYTCENEYVEFPGSDCMNDRHQCQTRAGEKDQFYFVADTKNFQVQFTSSYEQDDVHGTSLDHASFYELCPARSERANRTHRWADRLQHSERSGEGCGPTQVKKVKLPCAEGVACRQQRDFDFLYDTGIAVEGKESRRSKDVPDPVQWEAETKAAQFLAHPQGRDGLSSPLNYGVAPRLFPSHTHGAHGIGLLATSAHTRLMTEPAEAADRAEDRPKEPTDKGRHEKAYQQQQWASAYGDVFTLARLMELAGADLDNSFNFDGWSTREGGTVLEVTAVYSNLYPIWSTLGYKDVKYFYQVKELPLPYVSRKQLAVVQPADYPETRRYEVQHGIMIWFRVGGQFGNFKTTSLLIYLVTAFALIGAAGSVTDLIAVYVHPRRNNYFNLKYETSGHFNKMWECPKCEYWNLNQHAKCEQYPMWENSEEAERCGEPKPS